MTGPRWVARAAAEYHAGRPLALLFDYDGTLTPIAEHPNLAVLPAATRDTLAALAALDGVRVGVVSSRPLRHLRDLIELPGLWWAGSGGMHLDLGGVRLADPAAAEFDQLADPLLTSLAGPVRWFPGTWIERKPGCLTIHFRALTPLKAACLVESIRDTLAEFEIDSPPLRVREVSKALEVALGGAWTKGDAVDRMLAALRPEPFAVYAGDESNDTEAVARVNAAGGVTIGVGSDAPTDACERVATPADLLTDLCALTTALSRTRPSFPPAESELLAGAS